MKLLDRVRFLLGAKDLYDLHPELRYRLPIMRILSGMEQGAPGSGSYNEAAGFYKSQVWLHKAAKVVSDNIKPLRVGVADSRDKQSEINERHEVTEILTYPNDELDSASLWGEYFTDVMLGGEQGLEVVYGATGRRVVELWPRQPSEFSVSPDKAARRYRKVAAYKIDDGVDDPYTLAPDEFIHSKFYNPLNVWRGLSPVSAIRSGLVIDQLVRAWSELFFGNSARPDFAVIAPEGLTADERNEYENKLMKQHGGARNAHRPIILEKGITDIKAFSFPRKDVEWLAQMEMTREEIGAILGVPDEIMGFGRDTYENFDTADRVLWTLTIVPLTYFRDSSLTRFFRKIGKIKGSEVIKTDLSRVPQLQEDRSSKIDQFGSLVDHYVPPQMAADYLGLGLENIPEGDVVRVRGSARNPGDPMELSAPVTWSGFGERVTGELEDTEKLIEAETKDSPVPEYGSEEHKALWDAKQEQLDDPVEDMQRDLKKYFQRQQNEVGRRLRDGKIYGRGQYKQDIDNIPDPSSLFDTDAERELFIEEFREHITAAVEKFGEAALLSVGADVSFDLTLIEVQAGISHILETVAKKVNDTTWLGLVELFQEAEQEGEGIPAIMERLSLFFGDRKSDYQTERIARTTMTGASNHGTLEAWDQSGVVNSKSWLSALLPGRTRDAHAEAHGQTVGIREMFDVGGEFLAYPGDPSGAPENIINCLCSMIEQGVEV